MHACLNCATDISGRPVLTKYCVPCSQNRPRISSFPRTSIGSRAYRVIDGRPVCKDCAEPLIRPRFDGKYRRTSTRCEQCRVMYWGWKDRFSGKDRAIGLITLAKARGELQPATDFACVDCGRPAEQYDHRDYARPLDVEPVCRSCNVMRGSAQPINPFFVMAAAIALRDAAQQPDLAAVAKERP